MNSSRRFQTGLSLVEPLVTTTIASLMALAALPGLEEARDRHRLDSVVAQMESELQFARSSAVAQGRTVRVAFGSPLGGSCYVIHDGGAGDCTCDSAGRAMCAPGVSALRSVGMRTGDGLRLTSSAREMGFDATHGMVTPTSTLQFENRAGTTLRLVVNVMGRIRTCVVGGAVPTHPRC